MAPIADDGPIECVHAPPCGGCPLITSSYGAQLEQKQTRLAAALSWYPECRDAHVAPIRGAPSTVSYRPRAKLVVASPARIGLFAAGTHDVVDIPDCRVLSPALRDVTHAVRALLGSPPVDAGASLVAADGPDGALAAIDLREATLDAARSGSSKRSVLVTLVLDRMRAPEPDALRVASDALFAASPRIASVAVSLRDAGSPQLLGSELRVIAGPGWLTERAAPHEPASIARHGSFVQSHTAQAVALRARITSAIESTGAKTVLELYGGAGTLALLLSSKGHSVTMVESFAPAAEDARAAARDQSLALDVRAADAAIELRRLVDIRARFDAVVVDPPRRGLAPDVRAAITSLGPRVIAYVSCHPPTLARDLADLVRRGYGVDRVEPLDMMPHTDEVETLVVLVAAPRPPPRTLFEDDDLVILDKPPHQPITPRGAHHLGLLAHVRSRPGWEHAISLAPLDDTTSGVLPFARDPASAAHFGEALGSPGAVVEHIALVRGITRPKGTIRRALSGSPAPAPITRYRRERVVIGHSLLRLSTADGGDESSIRRHLAGIGHPVLGDARYGDRPSNRHLVERHGLDRPFLHRALLDVPLAAGTRLRVDSSLAPDLAAILDEHARPATTPALDALESSVAARRRRE